MTWFGLAALIAGARTPMQVAMLAYVGASGLAGVTIVGAIMLTPAGHAVQAAIEPARELVQSILPVSLPALWEFDPRQEISGRSAAPSVGIATQVVIVADTASELVVVAAPQPVAVDPSLVESSLLAAPGASLRPSQSAGAQSTGIATPLDAAQPALEVGAEADFPVVAQPAALPSTSPSPASVAPAAPRLAIDLPVVARPVPTAVGTVLGIVLPRVEVRSSSTSVPQAVEADLHTAGPVRSAPTRIRSGTPPIAIEPAGVAIEPILVPATLVPIVPTPLPVVVPTVAPTQAPVATAGPVVTPTHLPTSEPTQLPAPTATPGPSKIPGPSKTPVPPTPTQKPTQTSVPTKAPTQGVPTATPKPTVKPTAVPTHHPATATPVRGNRPPVNPPPAG